MDERERCDPPPELSFDRLDDAEKCRRAVPGYMAGIRDLYEAVQDRFREKGLELIRHSGRRRLLRPRAGAVQPACVTRSAARVTQAG